MKTQIKYMLSEIGLFPKLDMLRCLPEITRWIRNGCTEVAPPPIKRITLVSYLRRFRLVHFIETGTHLGDTLAYIAQNKSFMCISIELSDEYYTEAKWRFRGYPNVILKHGDSGVILPEVIRGLQAPALFWLDAHYSSGNTARGEVDTPVIAELQAILDSSIKTHIILIDDARCFDGTNSYPHLDDLLRMIREQGFYNTEVSADIIRITPKAMT